MKKLLAFLASLFTALALTGCVSGTDIPSGGGSRSGSSGSPLTIVAATELKDLQPLIDEASSDLGFPIEMQFPGGTLENSQALRRGDFDGVVDATWFATNRYVDLIGAGDKLGEATKIASSPIAFGVWEASAARLGWDTMQPTWAEFLKAAEAGEFTFGMTNPSASNSGFSALVAVATAVADTGQAISSADIERVSPEMQKLFQAQTLVSGSSGWLADAFVDDTERADAIINYEATLHQLRQEGNPIQVIVPADGVISADYPLATLEQPANPNAAEQVRELTQWLMEHQEEIAQTFRRPVEQVSNLPVELAEQQVIELPFPANQDVVDDLLFAYNNQYRNPGTTTFILDTSGSMEGERIASLKEIMQSLVDGSASTVVGDVSMRDRETVTLWSFDDTPNEPLTVEFNRNDPATETALLDYVDSLEADGSTAMYRTLIQSLENLDTSKGIPSIVLLSDGEDNIGPRFDKFRDMYEKMTPEQRSVPVFVILYGEAKGEEMEKLAKLTGGAVFDALNGDLESAFKEIRGFQ